MLMALLVVVVIAGWELYLRHTGLPLAYDDGKELWSDKRARVYGPPDRATVFIGASRIKFDLDIDTWQKLTGREAVMLAVVGSSPVPVLQDLADDPKFRGKLVVDVVEPLFFLNEPGALENPVAYIKYYKNRTPAQRASFAIDHLLESQFLFLDQNCFSLNAELGKWKLPDRPEIYVAPSFPNDFGRVTFERQNKMTDRFLADSGMQRQVQYRWSVGMKRRAGLPPPKEDPIPIVIRMVQDAVNKIRARGGEVVFVRPPSTGPYLAAEQRGFPRSKTWDPLLAATHCPGYFFSDYPATAHFNCPEWSHLSPYDAALYTKALIDELPPSFVKTPK